MRAGVAEAAELSHLVAAGPRASLLLNAPAVPLYNSTAEPQSRLLVVSQQQPRSTCCARAARAHHYTTRASIIASAALRYPGMVLVS